MTLHFNNLTTEQLQEHIDLVLEDDGYRGKRLKKQIHKAKKNIKVSRQQTPALRIENIIPKTKTQQKVFSAYEKGLNLFLTGSAGSGKSFIAMYLALSEILSGKSQYKQIVIVRSSTPAKNIGFLPGSESEKMAVYEAPYIGICEKLFNRKDAYNLLKQKEIIKFSSTSFNRGITLDESIVIVDEFQNSQWTENYSIITRLSDTSKIIFCGDFKQSDLVWDDQLDGVIKFMKIMKKVDMVSFIEFNADDIVRGKLVKQFVIACEDYNKS